MTDFTQVFARLREILLPHAESLSRSVDSDDELSLNTQHVMKNNQPLWFGGVQIKKRYVSYHLMPIYVNPELLAGVSPELKRRMQGKSCFNFRTVDEGLFSELADLTQAGFEDYRVKGYV